MSCAGRTFWPYASGHKTFNWETPCLYWASQVALVVKNLSANTGDIRDASSIPGPGRSPGGGLSSPLQYSCLENPHRQRNLVGYSPWGRKDWGTWGQDWGDLARTHAQTTQGWLCLLHITHKHIVKLTRLCYRRQVLVLWKHLAKWSN